MFEAVPIAALVGLACAMILAVRALRNQRLDLRSTAALAAIWVAIFLIGTLLASLWLTRRTL